MSWDAGVQVITAQFLPLLFAAFVGFIPTYLYSVINRVNEKNKYLGILNKNSYINSTLLEVNKLETSNKRAISVFFLGWIVGYVYFPLSVTYIIEILKFMYANELFFFFFNINPDVGINAKLIDAAYFNLSIVFLGVIWAFVYYKLKLDVTPGIFLSWKYRGVLYTLSILIGAIVITNFFIYFYIWKSIIPDLSSSDIPENWFCFIPFFICGLMISWCCIKCSFSKILSMTQDAKNTISNFYDKGYPYVLINTSSKQIKGKVTGVLDKNIIILTEKNNKIIATSWGEIVTIAIYIPESL